MDTLTILYVNVMLKATEKVRSVLLWQEKSQ